MNRIVLFSLLLLALSSAALADTGSANLIIPVAGRTAGAQGSEWYTDLVVTNLSAEGASVIVTFYPTAGGETFTSFSLGGWATRELRDVVGVTLNRSGIGMLRVSSATPNARLVARGYIYNRGNGGEFGQNIQGVPVDALQREHVISGITKDEIRRTNLGVANPWPVDAPLLVDLIDANGQVLTTIYPRVAPKSLLVINDVFREFRMTPIDFASVRVRSTNALVYPYASMVRSDTGDAIFIGGTGVNVRVDALAPRCSDPAALITAEGHPSAGDWIVMFDRNIVSDPYYVQTVIPQRYGLTIKHFYQHGFLGFSTNLTPQQIAALRCEPATLSIQENVIVQP